MKKFLALILSVAMIFALVACGSKEGDTPNTDGDTQQTDTPAAPVDIVIATGGTTGTYYAVGNALVTTIGDKLSLSKLTAVDSGRLQGERPARHRQPGPDVHPAVRRSELCSQRLRR